jgi:hypothetical protein
MKRFVLTLTPILVLLVLSGLSHNYFHIDRVLAWNIGVGYLGNSSNANTTRVNSTSSTNNMSSIAMTSANVKGPTDGGSLDVMVQASPFPLKTGDSKFKISFLQPSSETIQVHIDYDVVIRKSNTELFRASALTGQPLLHTAEGIINIPYKFDSPGHYTLEVSVMGINFIPIRTENVKFDFDVS